MAAASGPRGALKGMDRPPLENIIPNPYEPRPNSVPSRERPGGHYATPKGRTPLQQHLDYFDLNKDGCITPIETFIALRFLHFAWEPFNTLIAFWLALAFHLLYAYRTQDSWVPDPRLLIWTGNAEATTHSAGSSEVYDNSGHYIPGVFEQLWDTYDPGHTGRMGLGAVLGLVVDNASASDPLGSVSVGFQWLLTWWLFRDDDWCLRKSDMRSLYDGTGFYKLADRNGSPWAGMAARRDAVAKHHKG